MNAADFFRLAQAPHAAHRTGDRAAIQALATQARRDGHPELAERIEQSADQEKR